ncbi:hypothetical protein Q7P37_005633 [Cladosporium fusiforme]
MAQQSQKQSKHYPVQLRTNIRAPRDDELDHKALHSEIVLEPFTKLASLTTAEDRAVYTAILEALFPDSTFKKLETGSFLVTSTRDEEIVPRQTPDVYLIIFEGCSKPPQNIVKLDVAKAIASAQASSSEDDSSSPDDPPVKTSPFRQSCQPTGPKHLRTWRWFRTLFNPQHITYADWAEALRILEAQCDANCKVQFHAIRATVNTTVLDPHKLFERIVQANIGFEDCHMNGIPLQDFQQLISPASGSKTEELSAHSVELTQADACLQGTKVVSNVSLSVRPHLNGDLVVLEKPRTSVMLETDPWTLADLIRYQFHAASDNLHNPEQISRLTSALRGVKVKVSSGGRNDEETVVELKSGAASSVPLQLRHHAWITKGEKLEMTSLPCVNVGVPEKPILLPLELCKILPNQSLRGSLLESTARHVASICANNMPFLLSDQVLSNQCLTTQGQMIMQQRPADSLEDIRLARSNQFMKACDYRLPNILFVEAGDKPSSCGGWANLCAELENFFIDSIDDKKDFLIGRDVTEEGHTLANPQPRPILSLKYNNDPNVIDSWTRRLRDFVDARPMTDDRAKPILVIHLQRSKYRTKMRKAIEMACDFVLGVQAFFVSDESLARQADTGKAAEEIRRSFRLRNTSIPETKSTEMVLSIHISRCSNQISGRGHSESNSKNTEQFLVTVVSRCIVGSVHHYQTEVRLCSRRDVNSHMYQDLLRPFWRKVGWLKQLTVLRSGFMSGINSTIPQHELESQSNSSIDDAQDINQSLGLEVECKAIQMASAKNVKAEDITYVALTEDKLLELRDSDDNVTQALDEQSHCRSATALVYTKDTVCLNSDSGSVKVQHVLKIQGCQGVRSAGIIDAILRHPTPPPARQQTRQPTPFPQKPRKMLPASLDGAGGTPRATSTAFKQGSELSPGSPQPSIKMGDDDQSLQMNNSGRIRSSNQANAKHFSLSSSSSNTNDNSSKITSDMERLAAAWKDDWLQLYNTKWPVTTYLAHKAKDRAMAHLSIIGTEDQATTVPLPRIDEKVRETLYYL